MNNFLHPLPKAGSFQVTIADQVAAVIRRTSPIAFDIFILTDAVTLLAHDVLGSPTTIAERLASGEFDNDFRFDVSPEPDEDGDYMLAQIATPSQREMYRSSMRDPYGFIGRERECQAERAEFPSLEDRLELYAGRGW